MVADDITFKPAWRLDDPDVIRDARRLWAQEGISEALTANREGELCAAAYCNGEVAAISSAEIFYSSILRNNFFAFRCLVSSRHRKRDLAWQITAYTSKLLHEWSRAHAADKRIMGLMTIFETNKFRAGARPPIREKFGIALHFVAYTPEGQQVRIAWFDDAELDDGTAAC